MHRDALAKWWDSLPDGPYTCDDCGRTGVKANVQPQRRGGALCVPCISERNRRAREARRAAIAAAPRCEVPGCRRRGTWRVARVALLCGRHLRTAERALVAESSGVLWWIPREWTRAEVLRMAGGEG